MKPRALTTLIAPLGIIDITAKATSTFDPQSGDSGPTTRKYHAWCRAQPRKSPQLEAAIAPFVQPLRRFPPLAFPSFARTCLGPVGASLEDLRKAAISLSILVALDLPHHLLEA